MKDDHKGPKGGKFMDPSCVPPAVPWGDEASVRRWFSALREGVKDLRGAARDRVRRKKERVLSRYEARRQIVDASQQLLWLLEAGEAGFDGPAPHEPEGALEGGGGDEPPPLSGKRPRSTPPDEAG